RLPLFPSHSQYPSHLIMPIDKDIPPELPLFNESRTPRGLSQEKLSLYAYIIFASVFMLTFFALAIAFFFIVL
ncbi:hypothetical protein PFISCL1PPCAC_2355, partial [Pristionchus fissidentatus]